MLKALCTATRRALPVLVEGASTVGLAVTAAAGYTSYKYATQTTPYACLDRCFWWNGRSPALDLKFSNTRAKTLRVCQLELAWERDGKIVTGELAELNADLGLDDACLTGGRLEGLKFNLPADTILGSVRPLRRDLHGEALEQWEQRVDERFRELKVHLRLEYYTPDTLLGYGVLTDTVLPVVNGITVETLCTRDVVV